jgi:hypothetical protein
VTLAGFVCFADNLVASLKCGHGKNLARVHTHVNTHKVTENLEVTVVVVDPESVLGPVLVQQPVRPGSTTPEDGGEDRG